VVNITELKKDMGIEDRTVLVDIHTRLRLTESEARKLISETEGRGIPAATWVNSVVVEKLREE